MKKITVCALAVIFLFSFTVNADFSDGNSLYLTDEEFLSFALPASVTALNPTAQGAILINAETGEVLFEKNADEKMPIASVTKIMTLLLVFEALDNGVIKLDDPVTVSDNAASMGGSQAWMEPGEVLSVNEMIKAVAVSSCNDGAVALAEHLAGSEDEFVRRMNERAAELGMTDTSFVNCTGLDDSEVHMSTARDVSIMSKALISHETVFNYTTIWTDSIRNGEFGLSNTNKLIRFYKGANGLKTGSTSKAKYCLSATAKRDGMQLIAVVLGSPTSAERFADAKSLLDYGFANFALYYPQSLSISSISVKSGKKNSVSISAQMSPVLVKKGTENKITTEVQIAKNLTAPVDKGQTVGEIKWICGEEEIASVKITACETIEKADFFDIFKKLLNTVIS